MPQRNWKTSQRRKARHYNVSSSNNRETSNSNRFSNLAVIKEKTSTGSIDSTGGIGNNATSSSRAGSVGDVDLKKNVTNIELLPTSSNVAACGEKEVTEDSYRNEQSSSLLPIEVSNSISSPGGDANADIFRIIEADADATELFRKGDRDLNCTPESNAVVGDTVNSNKDTIPSYNIGEENIVNANDIDDGYNPAFPTPDLSPLDKTYSQTISTQQSDYKNSDTVENTNYIVDNNEDFHDDKGDEEDGPIIYAHSDHDSVSQITSSIDGNNLFSYNQFFSSLKMSNTPANNPISDFNYHDDIDTGNHHIGTEKISQTGSGDSVSSGAKYRASGARLKGNASSSDESRSRPTGSIDSGYRRNSFINDNKHSSSASSVTEDSIDEFFAPKETSSHIIGDHVAFEEGKTSSDKSNLSNNDMEVKLMASKSIHSPPKRAFQLQNDTTNTTIENIHNDRHKKDFGQDDLEDDVVINIYASSSRHQFHQKTSNSSISSKRDEVSINDLNTHNHDDINMKDMYSYAPSHMSGAGASTTSANVQTRTRLAAQQRHQQHRYPHSLTTSYTSINNNSASNSSRTNNGNNNFSTREKHNVFHSVVMKTKSTIHRARIALHRRFFPNSQTKKDDDADNDYCGNAIEGKDETDYFAMLMSPNFVTSSASPSSPFADRRGGGTIDCANNPPTIALFRTIAVITLLFILFHLGSNGSKDLISAQRRGNNRIEDGMLEEMPIPPMGRVKGAGMRGNFNLKTYYTGNNNNNINIGNTNILNNVAGSLVNSETGNNDGRSAVLIGQHIGMKIPSVYENMADLRLDETLPVDLSSDTPFFWHIPRSAGVTMNDILGSCFLLTIASDAGSTGGHDHDEFLQVLRFDYSDFSYVNVDISTSGGIARAKKLGLVTSGLADVAVSSLISDAASMFTNKNRGRMFTLLRHPIDRAVSLFYFLQDTQWRVEGGALYNEHLATIDIQDFYKSGMAESNWQIRFLTNQITKGQIDRNDLELAKEILRKKCLVGLLSEKGESLSRFERYFGWNLKTKADNECHERKIQWDWPFKHRHPAVEEGTDLWDLILRTNQYDMELYDYAQLLFREQSVMFQ